MTTPRPVLSLGLHALPLGLLLAVGWPLEGAVVDFGPSPAADLSPAEATDPALGKWHGSDKLLRTRSDAEGVHLVTPAEFPGPWISTVFTPASSLLQEDTRTRGLLRFPVELRLDAEPARRPRGNALILLVGSGGDEPGHALRLNLKDDGSVCFVGGGAETPVGERLRAGVWTRVEAEIDYDARSVALRVGEAPAVPGFPISAEKPRSRFGRVEFKTDGAGTAYRPLSIDKLGLERLR